MAIETLALIRSDLARIEADAATLGAVQPAAAGPGDAHHGASFAQSMRDVIQGVDAKEQVAADKAAAVDSGRSDDLVGAMLASQEASLSFSMLMQVRNKVVGAFDELIKLQL
ncbi:MAG: flagellar hook-basal body complex protein FliE [Actinomycetota bacterium]